ncbi:3-deoxy-manno-octulosonate cytidylyltransferase [Helicobacter jaachi]|uniref:3-deoxy-manno-octulosonate cytidylyltransferase n=1 Tax=Helicobacter jaachi TaxID=1677920 RepID=A0A4U8T7G8_9HELI|nr:3-deoxy-manno-octulosonate cytidylyltransferase [Helicobacter jaachi]TLD95474.1 3-deoxy-manno-octulosonate cytidylyltransferase [Helicobacter jaachi]
MIIIPARLQSTRFPQKVLCDIGGLPMVVRTALNAQQIDEVVVACDDERIESACKAHKIPCVLTSQAHTSGTDRCAEASIKLGLSADEVVINLQADEPFIESSVVRTLINLMREKNPFMASLAKVIQKEQIVDSNLVKVVLNAHNEAIYFSRSPIPFCRDEHCEALEDYPYLGHLGLYGFFAKSLQEFCALPKSPLEEIEKLEQLRALYHGKNIAMAVVQTQSVGIDTPKDYEHALKSLRGI